MKKHSIVVTCEHASNKIPVPYNKLFSSNKRVLSSHRGFDPGALKIAKYLAKYLKCPLIKSPVSRLLVDANRSIGNKSLFSSFSEDLSGAEKAVVLEKFYFPIRNETSKTIFNILKNPKNTVIHLSVHSFTPVYKGNIRQASIGILYDPQRPKEVKLAKLLAESLRKKFPRAKVRMNYPYRGASDGHCTSFRQKIKSEYLGLELEFNQKWIKQDPSGIKNKETAKSIAYAISKLSEVRDEK